MLTDEIADGGDSLQNGQDPAPDGSAGCNMACNGNATEICGSSNRLSMYQYVSDAPSSSFSCSASSTTPSPTISSTTSSTLAASAFPSTAGWSSIGRYNDSVNARTLMNAQYDSANTMSTEQCTVTCKAAGFTLAGTEYSGECCKSGFPTTKIKADSCKIVISLSTTMVDRRLMEMLAVTWLVMVILQRLVVGRIV